MEAILETKKLSHIYSAGTPFERGALVDVDFTAYRGFSHIAVEVPGEETGNEWLEPVDDEAYSKL